LGLSVAFGIAKSHQGTILADSRIGGGTDFDIYLPACSSLVVKDDGCEMSQGEGTVMVVEDEDLVREMTFNILTRSGYEVLCVADGEEAIELYRDKGNSIDLVILDMLMPRKDGLETFKELKHLNRHIRAVISTGYLPNHISSEFVKGGVMGFIQKPYTAAELSKLVRRILS
jgi:DNA-binding NtrC family response regulator